MSKPKPIVDSLPPVPPIELRRIVDLDEASRLTGLSKDTLKRHHGKLIRKLSPRRVGIRLGDVIALQAAE